MKNLHDQIEFECKVLFILVVAALIGLFLHAKGIV